MNIPVLPITVAIGGALGSVCRYYSTIAMSNILGTGFPYGTAFVNGAGSFLIGLVSMILVRYSPNPVYAAFLITGFLGGFTTFSSFMNESIQFLLTGNLSEGFAYIAWQLVAGIVFVFLGLSLGKLLIK